ncbi:MAG: GcrA cell cycle regulator [Candidatus Tokpelaia sp. JSC189]|nr:MAG: GcrA cell cycle regulator [Candidatus Tokpelaia sp. JSC189]
MNWTNERVELLKKLWAEGLSASQIAAQLGSVTRNAIIGKAHRLKLMGRGKITKAQPRARKTLVAAPSHPCQVMLTLQSVIPSGALIHENYVQTVGATALKLEFVVDAVTKVGVCPGENVVVPMVRHLSLLQLTENTCKWPVGDPLTEDFYFCGADSGKTGPYCSYHSKIAFQPVSERRRVKVS